MGAPTRRLSAGMRDPTDKPTISINDRSKIRWSVVVFQMTHLSGRCLALRRCVPFVRTVSRDQKFFVGRSTGLILRAAQTLRGPRSANLREIHTGALMEKVWRRGGDSNPRHPFGVKLLSRQPCSATPAPLRGDVSRNCNAGDCRE